MSTAYYSYSTQNLMAACESPFQAFFIKFSQHNEGWGMQGDSVWGGVWGMPGRGRGAVRGVGDGRCRGGAGAQGDSAGGCVTT